MPFLPRLMAAALLVAGALFSASVLADDYADAAQLHAQGERAAALERVERFLAAHPRDSRARFLKGIILTEQGKTEEAISVFRSLTEDFPELPEPHNNLAVLYASQGHYDEARRSLEMAVRAAPDFAIAYENLGDIYAVMAKQAYEKAAQLAGGTSGVRAKLELVHQLLSNNRPIAVAGAAPPPVSEAAPATPEPPKPTTATASVSAAPTPAAAPAPQAGPPPDPTQAVLSLVDTWSKAWSSQDVDAYLACYAPDVQRPKGQTREQWEASRRARLLRPKRISVEVIAPKVTFDGSERASVTFRQNYTTDSYKSSGRKTLHLVRQGERWLIEQEIFTTR